MAIWPRFSQWDVSWSTLWQLTMLKKTTKLCLRKSWCLFFVISSPPMLKKELETMLKKELVFVLCYFISPFLCSAAWRWMWQLEPILNHEPYPREWWCHDLRISWSRISGCSWIFTWQRKKASSWLSYVMYIYIHIYMLCIYICMYVCIYIYIGSYVNSWFLLVVQ